MSEPVDSRPGDRIAGTPYAAVMDGGSPFVTLHVDFEQPIEIGAFVGLFTSIGSQYHKFMRATHPDLAPDADMYVREVRPGSIDADLIPWILNTGLPAMINVMDQVLIVDEFVRTYGARLAAYFMPNGRDPTATKSDLKDFMDAVTAIANDPKGASRIESAVFEDGKRQVRSALKFNTEQAKTARNEIERHKVELEKSGSAEHERVMMTFVQSNIKDITVGQRSGERVVIPDISTKDRPLIYASKLAEERIKHEIREADDNVFKKGFIVDINIQLDQNGKPVAYRVTNFHSTIDLSDD